VQNRPENQALSNLIKKRLRELKKNQSWLAKEIRTSRAAVSLYVTRRTVPSEDTLERLYSSLGVPYKTLDDLLE